VHQKVLSKNFHPNITEIDFAVSLRQYYLHVSPCSSILQIERSTLLAKYQETAHLLEGNPDDSGRLFKTKLQP